MRVYPRVNYSLRKDRNLSHMYETKPLDPLFSLHALAKGHDLVTEYTPCQSTWRTTEEQRTYR